MELDYNLKTAEERIQALPKTMSQREAEWAADYILYADKENKKYGLKTQWDRQVVKDSSQEGYSIVFPRQHRKLSRKAVIAKPNFSNYEQLWFSLWKDIDETETLIAFGFGKELRPKLVERLSYFNADLGALRTQASLLTEKEINRLRHRLIELRTLQYTYLDCLINGSTIAFSLSASPGGYYEPMTGFRSILPFEDTDLLFDGLTLERLKDTSWALKALFDYDAKTKVQSNEANGFLFDFRIPSHVQVLIDNFVVLEDIEAVAVHENVTSRAEIPMALKSYLLFYAKRASLTKPQRIVFEMKCQGVSVASIAARLKAECNKDYSLQYISTIFTQQVVLKITAEAEKHLREVEFVTYGIGVFKRCSHCGLYYPRNKDYFGVLKAKSDGFKGTCKKCTAEKKRSAKEMK